MAELVGSLLQDLGLYGYAPATFPDLIIWVVTFVGGAALVAGTVKTFLIVCQQFAEGGFRRW